MSAASNLKFIHKIEGAELSNGNGATTIRSDDIGLINLPSGRIVLGDPTTKYSMSDFKRKCFAATVQPGVYPVRTYTAYTEQEKYLAFAEIIFTSKKPVKFVTAKTIVDTESKRRGFCGYPVHNSATGFMDADLYEQICSLPRFTESYSLIENEEPDEFHCATVYFDDSQNPCAVRLQVPSSYYYWYWGKDSNGEICCLIGDYFTFA